MNIITPFICKFCRQEATYAPLSEMSRHAISIFFCYNCSAEFTFWSDGQPASESIYIEMNRKTYRWTITVHNNYGYIWYIEEPGVPGISTNKKPHLIVRFKEDVPQITPANIKEKFKTYLVFV